MKNQPLPRTVILQLHAHPAGSFAIRGIPNGKATPPPMSSVSPATAIGEPWRASTRRPPPARAAVGGAPPGRVGEPRPRPPLVTHRGGRRRRRVAPRAAPSSCGGHPVAAGLEGVRGRRARARAAPRRRARR
jgi:hypothetical protein